MIAENSIPNDENDAAAAAQEAAQSAKGFLYTLCENIDNAMKSATDKASGAAKEKAPQVKKVIAKGAYKASYTATYGSSMRR